MAVHTPLPPNLRRVLTAFSSAIFTTTKTWDSSTAHLYHPGTPGGGSLLRLHCRQQWVPAPPAMADSKHQCCCTVLGHRGGMMGVLGVLPSPALPCPVHEVLASLPLQVMLYFNVCFFPCWCLAEGMMLQLKVPLERVGLGTSMGLAGTRLCPVTVQPAAPLLPAPPARCLPHPHTG